MKTKKDKQNMTESIRVKEANKAEEHEIEDEILKTMYYSIKPMGAEDAKLLLEDQPQNRSNKACSFFLKQPSPKGNNFYTGYPKTKI